MKVLSLNLWFSDYLRKERTIIFKNYILEKKPDVICIQEVIAPESERRENERRSRAGTTRHQRAVDGGQKEAEGYKLKSYILKLVIIDVSCINGFHIREGIIG
tara:strand:+ start:486 stop:794 length:309 start_codon:yes stop_codon:yes gene_type:complete